MIVFFALNSRKNLKPCLHQWSFLITLISQRGYHRFTHTNCSPSSQPASQRSRRRSFRHGFISLDGFPLGSRYASRNDTISPNLIKLDYVHYQVRIFFVLSAEFFFSCLSVEAIIVKKATFAETLTVQVKRGLSHLELSESSVEAFHSWMSFEN